MVQLFPSQMRKYSQTFSRHRIPHYACKDPHIDYSLKNQTGT